MINENKIMAAQDLINNFAGNTPQVKHIRKDRGLIERTESQKIILAEDNREVLLG